MTGFPKRLLLSINIITEMLESFQNRVDKSVGKFVDNIVVGRTLVKL